jgi:hypothetical protein
MTASYRKSLVFKLPKFLYLFSFTSFPFDLYNGICSTTTSLCDSDALTAISIKTLVFLDVALWILMHVINTSKELAASVVSVKVVRMNKFALRNFVTDAILQPSHFSSLL